MVPPRAVAGVAGGSAPGPAADHRYRRPVAEGAALRVVSFNLRNARALDGWNSWPFRRRATAAVLREHDPDIAGHQEAYGCQERYPLRELRRYTSVSEGRARGGRGGRCPVRLKPKTLRLLTSRTR